MPHTFVYAYPHSLCPPPQRAEYDATGKVVKTLEEEFVDGFGGGEK